jgi:hypothetical protein
LQLAEANGKSEVVKVLCQHGARGALCYAAKNDVRDMLVELISKGHDLEECDQVLVYEALSFAQVLVYETLSDLEECDQVLVYKAFSCAQVPKDFPFFFLPKCDFCLPIQFFKGAFEALLRRQ